MIKIDYTHQFIRDFKNLSPEKQKLANKKERIFKQDPFAASLKTHKLTGKLFGYWSFSVNYSDRVIFRFTDESHVLFYRIGSHDIYKR